MDFDRLTGPEKAAVLVLSLPPDAVRDFLGRLADDEVERILAAISRFEEVPARVQERVLEEFRDSIGHGDHTVAGGRTRAFDLVQSSLEPGRSRQILEKLGRDEMRVDWTMRAFEPAYIAQQIDGEHPQTIALMLSQIPAERGAAVISALPEAVRAEVVVRLADLETVSNDVITDLEEGVADLFGRRPGAPTRVGGTDMAAKVLNKVARADGQSILEGIDTRNPALAVEIRKRMLTFNDLAALDKRGIQTLLREVPIEDLVVALKTANEEMKEKVFSNVSSRAADQIKEEQELLGPMKLSDIEKVQMQIVEIARRLEEEGRITLDVGGGDDVLV